MRESAEKILKLKERLGLFESRAFATETGFDEAAKQAAEAGVTLVRDTQNLLPLKDKKVCAVLFADGIFSLQLRAFTDTLSNHLPHVNAVYSPRTPGKADEQAARACMAGADVTVLGTSRTSVMDQKQYALVQDLLKQAEQNNQPAVLVSLLNPYEIALYPQAQTVLALYGPTADTARIAAEILLGLRPAKGHLPIKLK